MLARNKNAVMDALVAQAELEVPKASVQAELERMVEGSFGKAFRSGLQPVELGRKVTREVDAHRQTGVNGVPVAPNNIGVYLSPADFDRFASFAEPLVRELSELVREHAPTNW